MRNIILLVLLILYVFINIRGLKNKTKDYSGYTNEEFIETWKNVSSIRTWLFFASYFITIISFIPDLWGTLLVNNYIATLGCVLLIVLNLITANWLYGRLCEIIEKKIDCKLEKPFWYMCSLVYFLIFDCYLIYLIITKIIMKI